jgi:drug/metabolite transporter (DMT)-like permease
MSYFILGEKISGNIILGSSLIVLGILLLSRGA